MASQENIRKLDIYQVEFTRLDEQQIVSWNIAVAPGQTEIQAIEKGEALFNAFATENGGLTLATVDEARDLDYRRNANMTKTYWRNRCHKAGEAFL